LTKTSSTCWGREDLTRIQANGKKQVEQAAIHSHLPKIAAEQMRTLLTKWCSQETGSWKIPTRSPPASLSKRNRQTFSKSHKRRVLYAPDFSLRSRISFLLNFSPFTTILYALNSNRQFLDFEKPIKDL
jgi:hypothetical protein